MRGGLTAATHSLQTLPYGATYLIQAAKLNVAEPSVVDGDIMSNLRNHCQQLFDSECATTTPKNPISNLHDEELSLLGGVVQRKPIHNHLVRTPFVWAHVQLGIGSVSICKTNPASKGTAL
jgi:hypothetical protein